MKVVIVDYGMGNLKSIVGALNHLGVDNVKVSNDKNEINSAEKLILPGVGAFKLAIKNIRHLNLDKVLKDNVLLNKKPLLGICLGMQLLSESSDEGGYREGLKFISGRITRFESCDLSIPHIGINQVKLSKDSKLYSGFQQELVDFYFVHSYKMNTNEKMKQGITNYTCDFVSSFEKENIAGVQYHPELSQANGLKVLSNFLNLF